MNNTEYAAGLAFGIVFALVLFIVIWKFIKKTGMKGNFDERQELVRGRGYKYAFFVVIILLTIELLAEGFNAFDILPLTRMLTLFFILLVGVMVYAIYCIRNDSYFGVGTDARTYKAVMWIVIVCNAVSGFAGLREGALVDGKLVFGPCASLLFCIAFIIIMISLSAKSRSSAEEDSAED